MPLVTIVIPTFNENKFISSCLESLLLQDIGSENVEILVVDGGSQDGTLKKVKEVEKLYPQVKLLINPNKFTVYAFNIGIQEASRESQYISFLNCHASYSKDRLRKAVGYIKKYNVDAVGGQSLAISRRNTLMGRTIASVLRSRFSTGSKFRSEIKEPQLADTASGCLYKKSVFSKIGLFNEKLIYSQDMELNKRLCHAGGKILFAPGLQTSYKARACLKPFLKHSLRNGIWVIIPFKYSNIMSCILIRQKQR